MRKKKLIAVLSALSALVFLSAQCAAAGAGRSYSCDSTVGEDGLPSPPAGKAVFGNDVVFSAAGDAEKTLKREKNGAMTVTLKDPEEQDGPGGPAHKGVALVLASGKPAADCPSAAAVSMLYSSGGGDVRPRIKVTVSFSSGKETLIFSDELTAGVPRTLYCDLSDFGEDAKIDGFSASAEWDPTGAEPGTLTLSEIRSADGGRFGSLAAMSSLSLSAVSGSAVLSDGEVSVTPEDGAAELRGVIDPEAVPSGGDPGQYVYYAEVRLLADSGSVSAEFYGSGDGEDGAADRNQGSSSIQVEKGEHSYMFRIPGGRAVKYSLLLRSSDNSPFTVKYMKLHRASRDDLGGEIPCTVTRNEIADGTLFFEGKLTKSASVRYSGERVRLCTSSFSGGEVTVLSEARVTNTMSLKASVKGLPQGGLENLYWLEVGGEEDDGVPITKKQFPAMPKAAEGNGRVFGLHGADPAGVFETGVSRVIVDVDLDELTGGADGLSSGRALSRGSELYYIDGDLVSRIDDDVRFYSSSGVDLYLRFVTDDPFAWLPPDGDGDAEDRSKYGLYLAAASFFCERYDNVASVVIPDVFGAAERTDEAGGLWDTAYRTALLARLTATASSRSGDPVFVTVPLGGDREDGTSEALAALAAEALAEMGPVSWAVMSFGSGTQFPAANVAVSSARANGTSFPSFAAVCYEPDRDVLPETFASRFIEMCGDSSSSAVRAVFLSLSSAAPDGLIDDFSILAPPRTDGSSRTEHLNASRAPSSVTGEIKGSLTLWDFSHAYSAGGWTAGTGISSFGTISTDGGGTRALRCVLDGDDSFGIVLCTIRDDMDLRRAQLVEFDFSVSSERDAEIVFLFGGEGGRTEYSVNVEGGEEELRAVCDLSESDIRERIGYVAVMIRSEGEVTVDCSRILCHSLTMTSEELSGAGAGGEKPFFRLPAGEKGKYVMLVGTVTVVLAVWLAVHCIRSDRDFRPVPVRRGSRRNGGRQL